MTSVMEKLYSTKDLSKRYSIMSASGDGLTRQTLYRWRKDRNFPNPKVKSPALLWLREDVHKWEQDNDLGWMQEALDQATH